MNRKDSISAPDRLIQAVIAAGLLTITATAAQACVVVAEYASEWCDYQSAEGIWISQWAVVSYGGAAPNV